MLYLLPNFLAQDSPKEKQLPPYLDHIVLHLDGLIAESFPEGRRFLGKFKTKKPPNQIPVAVFNQKTPREDLDFLLQPLLQGEIWGYVTDCGVPCLADPGALLVQHAKKLGVQVEAISGPSSVVLALMLSGIPSQSFFFHGYLPQAPIACIDKLEKLINLSYQHDATQVFIERPYRNLPLIKLLLNTLPSSTLLSIASDLNSSSQQVLTLSCQRWKKENIDYLHKRASVFLFKCIKAS